MTDFLRVLFSLSLSGSLLILLLLALRPLYRDRLSRAWQYGVWLLAAVRLLMPLPGLVSVADIPVNPPRPPVSAAAAQMPRPAEEIMESAPHAAPAGEPAREPFHAAEAAVLVWGAAAAAMAAYRIASGRGFIRFLQAGARPLENEALEEAFGAACRETGLRAVPVYVNPLISTPLLAGIFRPFVVLPDETMDPERAYHVFLHELTHRKRWDNGWTLLTQLAVCAHWFNPLVYLLQREIERSCELSCDEAVLRLLDSNSHRAYGNTLLGLVKTGFSGAVGGTASMSGGAELLKERLCAIMRYQERTGWQKCGACLSGLLAAAAALVFGCTLLVPQAQETKPSRNVLSVNQEKSAASGMEWSFKDVHRTGDSFSTNAFFADGYIIQLGWNVKLSAYAVTRPVAAAEPCTVAFTDKTKQYAGNEKVMGAIEKAVEQVRTVWYNGKNQPASPILLSVTGPFTESAGRLAERFYQERSLPYLSAVSSEADRETAAKLCRRAYADDRVAEFSVLEDALDTAERKELAQQAYRDRKTAFFSILSDSLGAAERERLAEQAYRDGEAGFFSILADDLEEGNLWEKMETGGSASPAEDAPSRKEDDKPADRSASGELARQAYRDGKISFFYMLEDALDDSERAALAKQAYEEDKVAFFYALEDALDDSERAALAKQAYEDDKISFFYSLEDALSREERAALARRAYADNKISFFYSVEDALSGQERAALAKEAYKDNRINFFYALSDALDD